jgi:hypothetical protein
VGFLDRLDRRNQAVADFQRARPDLGTEPFPYAKDDRSRHILRVLCGVCFLTAFVAARWVGWAGFVVLFVVLFGVIAIASWKLEHHPWLRSPGSDESSRNEVDHNTH